MTAHQHPWLRRLVQAVSMLLFLSATALATDYYVDPVLGKDLPGRGTSGAPWMTIQYAVQQGYTQAAAGNHTFHLAAGTYTETVLFNFPYAKDHQVSFVGASRSGVVIDGGFKMLRVMRGLSVSELTCKTIEYEFPESDPYRHLTVANCRVSVRIRFWSKSAVLVPLTVVGSHVERLEFDFCCDAGVFGEISDCIIGRGGILGSGGHSPLIFRRSLVRGPVFFKMFEGSRLTVTECVFVGGGLKIGGSAPGDHDVVIRDCAVSGTTGPGIELFATGLDGGYERMQVDLSNTVIYGCSQGVKASCDVTHLNLAGCWIVDNTGPGVEVPLLTSGSLNIQGTVIARNKDHGVVVRETRVGRYPSSIEIANSIVANNRAGIAIIGVTASKLDFAVTGCTVVDNTVSGIEKTNILESNAVVDHCILVGTMPLGATPWIVSYCLNDKTKLAGSHNIGADPKFFDRARENYRLDLRSPAIDAGVVGSAGTDYEGDPRHVAIRSWIAYRDIGADEFSYAGMGHRFGTAALTPGMPRISISASAPMKIGQSLTFEAAGPRPADLVFWIADPHEGPIVSLVAGIPIYLGDPDWILIGSRKPSGEGVLTASIPNDVTLVGAGLAVQAVAASAAGFAVSPLLRFAIGK